MTCLRCLKARRALAEAYKALVKGDRRRAGAEVKAAGAEIAGKIKGAGMKPHEPRAHQNSPD